MDLFKVYDMILLKAYNTYLFKVYNTDLFKFCLQYRFVQILFTILICSNFVYNTDFSNFVNNKDVQSL